ncbi:MAG: ATP-dependent DNA ligase [Vicinamibacterales bacterium]
MKRFATLFAELDQTTSTNAKVDAMVRYFSGAPPDDAAWAVFFLTGRRLKRLLPWAAIGEWTLAATGFESWLLEESWAAVGDGAETAALMLDQLDVEPAAPLSLAAWLEDRVLALRQMTPAEQQAGVIGWVRTLDRNERLVLLKMLTGELRLGVSQGLVVRALAQMAGLQTTTIAARLMGEWPTTGEWFTQLVSPSVTDTDLSRPYPFYLASPLEASPETLGNVSAWLVEWKWDGIRAQLVRRRGSVYLWSRGEELITERFPEVTAAASRLPDGTVLDGEVLAFREGLPLPFSALQQRIGRQKDVARLAREVPVVFMTYDLLEVNGRDLRGETLAERRRQLETLLPSSVAVIRPSASIAASGWDELAALRQESRSRNVEGLMLKRLDSPYGAGRKRGDWWKWKIEPHTMDAVLIYAQPGSGKRASLLTDYTFGVWHEGTLVPVAKAYSGLSNAEIEELDRWIRRHTIERFGPVRHVEPLQVFELGFEAIAPSARHKSGIAVRFPRMLRWRKDKPASEADSLPALAAMARDTSASH